MVKPPDHSMPSAIKPQLSASERNSRIAALRYLTVPIDLPALYYRAWLPEFSSCVRMVAASRWLRAESLRQKWHNPYFQGTIPKPDARWKLTRFLRNAIAVLTILPAAAAAESETRPGIGLTQAAPEAIGLVSSQLKHIDGAVRAAIESREIPGAVVLVARRGRIGYLKAFGNRAVSGRAEPMTVDTIFDLASLTKVMAATPAIMTLVEEGKIRLDDKVKRYLPSFTGGGKENITLRQLLTHYSGLRADFDLSKVWTGYDATMQELWSEATQSEPGKEFLYSDLNFITLGEVVRAVSGQPLDVFLKEHIYSVLRMSETTYNPPADWRPRIAPTESRDRSLQYLKGHDDSAASQVILRGEVHDPTAWRMGGVSGHAGLFSSARDVAIYAQMLLNRGRYTGVRVFSPLAVRAMTTPQSPKSSTALRGFGWDIETAYSSPRGDIFADGYGHTGFTGTSLWISPATETFIVILSNRVHPDGKGDATHLRGVVADIVAASIPDMR
jgi:CubicO group peptidase (beta-lactamase class C family)